MSNRLKGKVALVTAAGQGIGRATAIAFAREGAEVWATDINVEALNSLAKEVPNIKIQKLNVLNSEEISALANQLAIDILFNCVGHVHQGTILDCTEKDWDFSFNLNVKSMLHMSKAFLPSMLKKGS